MAINDNKQALKSIRQRTYLARDFDGFRNVLLDYARKYYPDRIQDFSEASVGGLFLDMASYIGDNMSFYMDHLYSELNLDTAVETNNIERELRNSNIVIRGASSALATVDFYIEIPVNTDGTLSIDPALLPTINAQTAVRSDSGVVFTLMEDIHFWSIDEVTGETIINPAVDVVNGRKVLGNVVTKVLRASGLCNSGNEYTDTFGVGSFTPFRKLRLTNSNVTQIISVFDSLGNTYYEVSNLANDVVYRNVLNVGTTSNSLVKDSLKVIPAPYRFISQTSLADRSTTLTFGGGSANSLEDDVIPDPSEFSIPLPFSQYFSRVPVNPQKMLQTNTLGIAGENTTITVVYRHGGGLSHNVAPGTIRTIVNLVTTFPENPTAALQSQIRASAQASNRESASGGEDAPTTDELIQLAGNIKNSQERIVTKEDLLARVYTMPSNFGRVFRATITRHPSNPLASRLYIVSRNRTGSLITSPDALKLNLKRYLNSYRLISDAIDVMDASIIDLEIYFQIVVDPSLNKNTLLQSIILDLQNQFNIKNFHIGQPIIISDVLSTIYAKRGVISVDKILFKNLSGTVKNQNYSEVEFDVEAYTKNQIIYPPPGSIFQIRYPDINITGKAVSNA